MQIKKTAIVAVFVSAIFVSANFMVAKAYEPLVRIPGLPAAGPINLSQYIVGLYNFLLSIVGIVAVMMLIIGGMKYITAAGNMATVTDAKDTIWNAILGLLLALLSWVIVSTINPDVLYIKHPASSIIGNEFENDLGACGFYDGAVCTCKDGTTPFAVDQPSCETVCADACGTTEGTPCIGYGENNPSDGICHCVDGYRYNLGIFSDCQKRCSQIIGVVNSFSPCLTLKVEGKITDLPDSDSFSDERALSSPDAFKVQSIKVWSHLSFKTRLVDPFDLMPATANSTYTYTYKGTNCGEDAVGNTIILTGTFVKQTKEDVTGKMVVRHVSDTSLTPPEYCWVTVDLVYNNNDAINPVSFLVDSGMIKIQVETRGLGEVCFKNTDCDSNNCDVVLMKCIN